MYEDNTSILQQKKTKNKKNREAIESSTITNHKQRLAFVRECVANYEPMVPYFTMEKYTAITQALLKTVPCLRDRSTIYWVSVAGLEYFREECQA